ncbi:hypothetical protein KL930_003659 [Ogataea haglerorum]|uniref:SAGA-associated factor 11 n=1 Tax=Ogataea haglerorum TaxID=1937702 RepID=A0ABQ7REV7_9ASCO|nr:hypothetical protein KL915_003052 [Ogataea haglerorum]KAG7707398.1 hypothetical protein KL950_003058 [Ogataea haglerorum]KAG7718306.1 hypothetical protein KL913_002301 [Ogataea haglerorum]KAG7718845.1 hypothetical protein KL949_002841 [Ogataea haglerorum]KAG7737549.1 hypothetical protein KL923_003938 [Ogataea haglerorum]
MTVTYSSVSISILEDMLLEIAGEIISRSILDEKLLRQDYGMAQPGLVEEGETAAGLVKKVRQNIGNSASGSSQSSAAATPQSGESGSVPDIGRIGFLQNGREIFPRSANSSDAYFQCLNCERKIAGGRFAAHIDKCLGGRYLAQISCMRVIALARYNKTSSCIWLARARSVHEPDRCCRFWRPTKNFRLVFGNGDGWDCSDNRKRKEQTASCNQESRLLAVGSWTTQTAAPESRAPERWLNSRSVLGHAGLRLLPDTVHGCEAEHGGTLPRFTVFGSFQIQPPPN